MNIKKRLSQFLLASMLLSCSTPAYPVGFWSGLLTKTFSLLGTASKSIKKNPTPVLFATAAMLIAVAGSFYAGTLWTGKNKKKKRRRKPEPVDYSYEYDTDSQGESSDEENSIDEEESWNPEEDPASDLGKKITVNQEPCIGTEKSIGKLGISVKQAKVLDQNKKVDKTVVGGGGASCGYQTFKNALIAVYRILGKELPITEQESFFQQLNDHEIVTPLIGNPQDKNGRWREAILQIRPLDDNGEWLDANEIAKLVRNEQEAADGLLKDVPFDCTIIPSLTFVAKDPQELINDFDIEAANRTKTSEKRTSLEEQIRYAQGLTDEQRSLLNDKLDELTQITSQDAIVSWLFDNNAYSTDLENRFKATVKNCSLLDEEQVRHRIIETQKPIKDQIEAAREAFEKNKNHTHVFMLGTMNYSLQQMEGSMGHWFAVVVHQENGQREYNIYDSLNHVRLNDERVIALIQMLEDCEREDIQDGLKLTQEELEMLAGRILSLLGSEITEENMEQIFDLHSQYKEANGQHDFTADLEKWSSALYGAN